MAQGLTKEALLGQGSSGVSTINNAIRSFVSHSGPIPKASKATAIKSAPKIAGNPQWGKQKFDGAQNNLKNSEPSQIVTSKTSSINGEKPMKYSILNAFYGGVRDALEKVAQIPMPPMDQMQQMPMQQMPMQQMPMQQMPMGQMQQAPAEPMVGSDMSAVQADMGAAPQAPVPQASPEELQQVQNSGITANDIASAAKVIQTMAEMKANADMAGIQAVDQSGAQAPGYPAR